MSLWSEFLGNDGVRAVKSCHYFPIYERHFSRFRNLDVTLFEIGVWHGGSLKLWKQYFGPNAKIIGIDIEKKCRAAEEDQISVRIGSQSDVDFLDSVVAEFGLPDIVIDDGSHVMSHVNATFDHLYPRLSKNAIYLVEDTFFSYWREAGGGIGSRASFIERTKRMIDLLHADYTRGEIEPTEFTRATSAIHIYDGVIVFEKHRRNTRITVTGSTQLFDQEVGSNAQFSERLMKAIYGGA